MDKKGWKKKYFFSELFFQKDGKNAALVFLIKNAALVSSIGTWKKKNMRLFASDVFT